MNRKLKKALPFLFVAASAAVSVAALGAYKGHGNDIDTAAFFAAYPSVVGGTLDSCETCHRGGKIEDAARTGHTKHVNACDYCHAVHLEMDGDAYQTLNPFGRDYLKAGRDEAAVKAIARRDSDRDGVSNAKEIAAATFPGDPASSPRMKAAPYKVIDFDGVRLSSPIVTQTMFLNSTKSKAGDVYSDLTGVRLIDMLRAAGMSRRAESVDVIAADGYMVSFSIDELKESYPQSPAVADDLSKDKLGDCGWVRFLSNRVKPGESLPAASIIIAIEENGTRLETAFLDPKDHRIKGDGPFKLAAPQKKISPPDLPSVKNEACGEKVDPQYRFNGLYEHNAGAAVKAVVAIRINPLPSGTRDIDWKKTAFENLKMGKILLYGDLSSR